MKECEARGIMGDICRKVAGCHWRDAVQQEAPGDNPSELRALKRGFERSADGCPLRDKVFAVIDEEIKKKKN
ncbi:MAG: hypothetical protein HYV39_02355 [Candidatus Levybacteria bacterium]|nr:hypothetical protein [Candidatus Levybacteria bacterium]